MKYIVYKTTNLVNNYIYIGVHKTINPDIFDGYLGCGVWINNSYTFNYPKTAFQIAVKEFGVKNFKREVISSFAYEEEAYRLEELLVNEEFLKRPDVYNMVLGGHYDGARPIICYQYDLSGNFLAEFPSMKEASLLIGKSDTAVWNSIKFKTSCGGYYWSIYQTEKLDVSQFKLSPSPIKVYRYLVDGGKFDCEFSSLSEAADQSKFTLIQVARSARLCYRVGDYQFLFVKEDRYDLAKTKYLKTRPVYKYSSAGKFVEEYDTQEEAERKNPGSNITNAIKNKKCCKNGFKWGLEKLSEYNSTQTKKKAVGVYKDGKLIETFDSVKACCKKYGVSRAHVTVGKTYKDYTLKHIEMGVDSE